MRLADLTTDELRALLAGGDLVALLPVGSVEPHGPHLPLATDTLISEAVCARALPLLGARGIRAVIAPAVPYGVTDFAAGFAGALGVPAGVLTELLRALVLRYIADGFAHVCLVNNHLEPAHDVAVRAAIEGVAPGRASVACPLTRRWGRTLSDEYKRGNCHAGQYETSLLLAADVPVRAFEALPAIETSLSEGIRAGQHTFREMGLDRAYTGNPAGATRGEGNALLDRLAEMVATEIFEAIRS